MFLLILHKNGYSGSNHLLYSSGKKVWGTVWEQNKHIWYFSDDSPSPLIFAAQALPELGVVSMKLATPGVFLFCEFFRPLLEAM